jgi:hypothetical protein
MRRMMAAGAALTAGFLAVGIVHASGQATENYPKGHYAELNSLPDWGGVWQLEFSPPQPGSPPAPQPQLKGTYLKDYRKWQEEARATQGDVPSDSSHCLPPGVPIIMMIPQYPIEFLFTPGRVTIHHEAWMQWRNIYTDGRAHPAESDPSFNGNSIGHWEGNTLVVDTVGTKDVALLGFGMKHSPKIRITERFHLTSDKGDVLIDELTIADPEALEKPWTTKLSYTRSREGELLEFECAENDRNPVDANGRTGFK